MLYSLLGLTGASHHINALAAHPHAPGASANRAYPASSGSGASSALGVSGQGKLKFRVLYTAERLPPEARKVLVDAHGGFAVDRRPGKEETYFAIPGAGILRISSDLKAMIYSTLPMRCGR